MTRRCILQIGTEKTGSTTLQSFLARNRDRLAQRGFRYPRFAGELNHVGLAWYGMDDDRPCAMRAAAGVRSATDMPAFRAHMEAQASAELTAAGHVILCNEHCHSRLTTSTEVRRLRRLLLPHFDRIDVSVYLRRQDQLAVSLYSTRLKSGATDTDILPRTDGNDPLFNYDASLSLWEDAFGRNHVHVRIFDPSELLSGDVVEDFLAAWDLGTTDEYRSVRRTNESIDAVAQDYLRRINASVRPVEGLPLSEVLGPLSEALARYFPGKGARPSRAAALAFYEMFRTSNEAVRRRHFPDRSSLFSDDFAGYPEHGDRMTADADELAAVAARLQTAQRREILRLEAEIRIREGRIAWDSGHPEAAVSALRNAVSLLPDHPESQRGLAEYLLRTDRHDEAITPARRATELRPRRQEFWHFLGVVLRRAGDLEGAADAQVRSIALDPCHQLSHQALATIQSEMARVRAKADTGRSGRSQ